MSDEYIVAKYLRLSLEDGDLDDVKDESNSISNQRKLLDFRIAQFPEFQDAKVLEFVDDGFSGTNFDRPKERLTMRNTRQTWRSVSRKSLGVREKSRS